MKAIAEVDSVGEHGQSGGFEDDFLTSFCNVLRPAESALFESLGDDPVAGAVIVEDFDEILSPVGEEEGSSAGRVGAELITGEFGKPVEGFAHVAGSKSHVDFEVAVEGEHSGDQARALISWAKRVVASAVVAMAVAPPGSSTRRPSGEDEAAPISARINGLESLADRVFCLRRLVSQEVKVGYLMPCCSAKARALRLLRSKAARASSLKSAG